MVIMGRWGVSQKAGVLVVLVLAYWCCNSLKIMVNIGFLMSYYFMAPSRYLSRCWHITNAIMWHLVFEGNFHGNADHSSLQIKKYLLKIRATSLRGQWVISLMPIDAYSSVNYSIIGSDDGLPPVQCQTITRVNADKLSMRSSMKFAAKLQKFNSRKWIWNCHLQNGGHFASASNVSTHKQLEMHGGQSSKLAGSPKSEASEIMVQTSETILALVRSDS